MLILPLHQPITRRTFPLVTALLVLVNLWVYFVLQRGDEAAMVAADTHYHGSGLAEIEAPAYARWFERHADPAQRALLQQAPADMHASIKTQWQQTDAGFRQALRQPGEVSEAIDRAEWEPRVREFDRLQGQVFTLQYSLSADAPSLGTALSSMFLHGGAEHLIGNLLFLIALGLLVEGPLGPLLFTALYLLGGAGAAGAWLASNEHGSVLGASGAIAALMGAFCVLWGRRKVRFFYWFFVVFDYVKAPALTLLPLWLGWELLQWALRDGERVAYEAHAGGIVSGALLALTVTALRWQREAWFELEVGADAASGVEYELRQAQAHLGHLRLREAEQQLAAIEQRHPGRFDVAVLRLRCAQYGKDPAAILRSTEALVQRPTSQRDALAEQLAALQALQASGQQLSASIQLAFAQRLLAAGQGAAALPLLTALADRPEISAELPQAWLSAALQLHQRGEKVPARALLQALRERFAAQPQAAKAHFLLGEWGE